MNRYKSITFATLLLLGSVTVIALSSQGAKTLAQTPENQATPLPLLNYLVELGRDNDCFFTIEEAWEADKPTDSIDAHWLRRASKKQNLEQELEYLRQTISHFTYEVDKANPRIVHIRDARLAQQKAYGLEGVVKRIDFKGLVNDLPAEIQKQGLLISPPLISETFQQTDYTTVAQVKGEGLKVRDALSNFIPLEGRKKRILWIARTKLGQGEVTYVYYP